VEIPEFGEFRHKRVCKEGQAFESVLPPGLSLRGDDVF